MKPTSHQPHQRTAQAAPPTLRQVVDITQKMAFTSNRQGRKIE